MTNLEHLVENGLVALENECNYNEWLEQMKEDINWNCCERLTIDDLWEICQYVFYVWTAERKTENCSEIPNNCDTCRNKGFEGCEQPCLGCGCCGLYEPKDEPTISKMEQVDEPKTQMITAI